MHGFISLPADVMKKLHDNPNVTLVFAYTYQGVPITLTIPGSSVELDPKIQWYGNVVTCKRYPDRYAKLSPLGCIIRLESLGKNINGG